MQIGKLNIKELVKHPGHTTPRGIVVALQKQGIKIAPNTITLFCRGRLDDDEVVFQQYLTGEELRQQGGRAISRGSRYIISKPAAEKILGLLSHRERWTAELGITPIKYKPEEFHTDHYRL